jgi:hypothetical protein
MAPHIWLSRGGKRWLQAADEKGYLDISSLASRTGLRPEGGSACIT